ncbi:unnamed protein product [Thelazia callipaeda]|uniref:VWFA domain-containing protein n=1 Tax=Thelazia callipaeda TaxID=103827 RepID=A0A0N5CYH1_THECL|nr:unnamed protein product [Thelazia callipaeda]
MNDDDEPKGYMWEVDYAEGLNIKDVLREDESGSIERSIAKLVLDAKRKKRLGDRPAKVRLGIMRYMYVIIDCSNAMTERSLQPSRLIATVKAVSQFLDKYSEQNPISQVGIIVCKDKRAEVLIPLTGNVRLVKESISTLTENFCHGEFSLHNSLMTAIKNLHSYPGHASREVLLVVASLSTCDPASIYGTFELLKRYRIRCSVISLGAEVFVFKKLSSTTSGQHDVVLDNIHFEIVLNEHTIPPPFNRNVESSVVRMGFPVHESIDFPSFCLWHHQSEIRQADGRGFFCPQCGARYCSLPVECRICKLVLISAPQLARSLHNLLPLPTFEEVDTTNGVCFACIRPLDEKSFACRKCKSTFCIDCDVLLHESLQICPGCKSVNIMRKRKNGNIKKRSGLEVINPFELKYNRLKHKILGTRTASTPCGKPGLTKKKSFENRIRTLAVEWKERGKRNKIVDQRIGERNTAINEEERISKRFTAERMKESKLNNMEFDVKYEETLTHEGRSLTEIEKYDRTMVSDDDDDDERGGNINAKIVAAAHFGGGNTESVENDVYKRKDAISELIAQTKQQRLDKKMAREERENATQKLDDRWKELMQTGALVNLVRAGKDKASTSQTKSDEYDNLFSELRMDHGKKGEASEREKTDDELAREERKDLIRQEKNRIAQMNESVKGRRMNSKDKGDKESFWVKYDSSCSLINAEKLEQGRIKALRIGGESSSEDESGNYEMDDDEDFDAIIQGIENNSTSQHDVAEKEEKEVGFFTFHCTTILLKLGLILYEKPENVNLPFVIKLPQKYEDLKKLLDVQNGENCEILVMRLIKLYHPSLREGNKSRLGRLFIFLLRYYDDLSKGNLTKLNLFGFISRGLHALMKFNIEYSTHCMRALLRQQNKSYMLVPHKMFTFRFIAYIKLVSVLYPLLDGFHPVVSPTVAVACHLISNVRIQSIKDAARVLLMLKMLASFVEESNRYLPEAIAFICGILLTAVENEDNERFPTASFPISLPHRRMLFVTDKCSTYAKSQQLNAVHIFSNEVDRWDAFFGSVDSVNRENDETRLCVLNIAINVLHKFSTIYSNNISFSIIFKPVLSLLARLPRDRYPEKLLLEVSACESFISAQSLKSSLCQLRRPFKQKKILTMLEPRFEEGYDLTKGHYQKNAAKVSKKVEIKQLTKKYKKQLRGTIRELRRDNQFLNREKQRDMLERDRARKQKTKWLISTLQGQESEYKKNAYMSHK